MFVVDSMDQLDVEALQRNLEELESRAGQVDKYILNLSSKIQDQQRNSSFKSRAFVTDEDIRNITTFKDQTLIAIKAPSGSTLAVPYPDQVPEYDEWRYQIYLKSQDGPVDIYLVSNPRDDESGATSDDSGDQNMDCLDAAGGYAQGGGGMDSSNGGFLRMSPPLMSPPRPDAHMGGFCDFYSSCP